MLQAVARPGSLAEAHAVLASRDRAMIIAGGTVVMPILNYGTDAFDTLVSLRAQRARPASEIAGGKATVGAMTTLSRSAGAATSSASCGKRSTRSPRRRVRNMATVGGNLFVKQPYGDLAACLIALGATASISGPSGERSEPVERTVAAPLGRGEIVTSVSLCVARRRHVQVPQGGPQGVQLGGDRHRRGSRLGQRRQGRANAASGSAASPHRRSARLRSRRR